MLREQSTRANKTLLLMSRFVLAVLVALQAGCATYKIAPVGPETTVFPAEMPLSVQPRHASVPDGLHCFEPMLYALTVGIVPAHCVTTYDVMPEQVDGLYGSGSSRAVEVTHIQGWLALLLAPFPGWRYGFGEDIDAAIEASVRDN